MHTPQAWLRLNTEVVEKTDYLTGRNVRYLRVETPDLPSPQSDKVNGDRVETPPPRDNNDDHFGGSDRTRKRLVQTPALEMASKEKTISPDRLFGGKSSGRTVAAVTSNGGAHEGEV